MSPDRYYDLSENVCGFAKENGSTYQEHILLVAAHRIPHELHSTIMEAPTAHGALEILKTHGIPCVHEDDERFTGVA